VSKPARTDHAGRRSATETVHFDDPDLLRRLVGPNDAHLTLIEEALDVALAAPGGVVTITGLPAAREAAQRVLQSLYDQLWEGRPVGVEEVRAALHLNRTMGSTGASGSGVIQVSARKSVKARTAMQFAYVDALADPALGLIFGVGPAGTGKTYLAVAHGAAELLAHKVERLVVARPAVEAGERLGFLPGALEEKVDPYMLPIWDALRDSLGQETLDKRRDEGRIEVAPLAYMRGRTLTNAFVLIDEAQNATASQMQMVLTRIGEGTTMVVTGDPSQVDLKTGEISGLADAVRVLDGVEGVGVIRFGREDVVRHPLVGRIVHAYETDAAGKRGGETSRNKKQGGGRGRSREGA
jgi:phosphate starvation-inducible PhoH-like protein